jgi:indole-3-glycerol phosphate synthase
VTATYLDRILERHRESAAADSRSVEKMLDEARSLDPARGFREALVGRERLAVIAEIKRRSPSKGDLNVGLDPAEWAASYERGGAACLSVLTDTEFFGGSVDDLRRARDACSLPVIRKDFTVCERDVLDTRIMGADCVLLIAAALEPSELAALHALAGEVGLDALVEIHDERELEHALAAGAAVIGVNQRDLVTFQVDHERARRMAGVIPDHAVKVAESGVRDGEDARSLREAGYDAVLVGETLVTSGDPSRTIAELMG